MTLFFSGSFQFISDKPPKKNVFKVNFLCQKLNEIILKVTLFDECQNNFEYSWSSYLDKFHNTFFEKTREN